MVLRGPKHGGTDLSQNDRSKTVLTLIHTGLDPWTLYGVVTGGWQGIKQPVPV